MYRILWTRQGVEGGWYNDVDAADAPGAAWQVAVNAPRGEDGSPAVLVSVSELAEQAQAAAVRSDGG